MREELKERLEEFVNSTIEMIKSPKNNLFVKRLVLRTSYSITNETLVFNYTDNCFLKSYFLIMS